ncbi:hypothetical protein DBR43_29240 [Pedobacter sp. KBW06]|uniref:RNA polymerase sigma-70 factor n=1 Tax=Pedobacter sp. KBW06 TaxID=2153359 RepID=UPI000F5A5E77|nr:RNA polymerase sigma-70 factor [Pedobacter sp. KBW06]RQO66312.1 hypothetical protein DBR43_29240 [Pedobacter sp. KBW06]
MEDFILIDRIKADDQNAFETVFQKYWDMVLSVCIKYTGSEEDAKELTQDIFYSIWTRRADLTIKTNLSAYLHQSAKNKSFNFLRDRERQQAKLSLVALPPLVDGYSAQEIDLKELRLMLQQTTNKLIEPGKGIFKLSREESLSHREIALRMNISVKTVEYHIGKALRHFKTQLKDYL